MVILDTNIVIDHLRTLGKKESYLVKLSKTQPKDDLAISVLTIQELFTGKSTLNTDQEKNLLAAIAPLKVLPYTFQVAKLAGQISRDSKDEIEFVDIAIASTAIVNDALLFTLNRKDFSNIKDLELFNL